jgi:hypothetical protein
MLCLANSRAELVPEPQSKSQAGPQEANVAPSNASITNVPSGGPASPHKSIQKQPTLQRREEPRSPPQHPPLSLRHRASRFTSNILSSFRSRKESRPADDVYPKVAYLYDPRSEDRGEAYMSPSPSNGGNPERWPEVPRESLRNPDFYQKSHRRSASMEVLDGGAREPLLDERT